MKSEQINSQINNGFSNSLLHGDCIEFLSRMASNCVDFVLTDPPYLGERYVNRILRKMVVA